MTKEGRLGQWGRSSRESFRMCRETWSKPFIANFWSWSLLFGALHIHSCMFLGNKASSAGAPLVLWFFGRGIEQIGNYQESLVAYSWATSAHRQEIKMTFSDIMWFEHFLFHQILTIFQHSHHFWAKSSLQVGKYLIIHTCKLIFTQWWWKCWNIVKIWWKTKCSNHMISKNVLFSCALMSVGYERSYIQLSLI